MFGWGSQGFATTQPRWDAGFLRVDGDGYHKGYYKGTIGCGLLGSRIKGSGCRDPGFGVRWSGAEDLPLLSREWRNGVHHSSIPY